MDAMRDEIAKLVQDTCKVTQVGPSDYAKPLRAMGIDSLDSASLFLAIMENYGVDIPDEKIDQLNTIDAIAAYVNSLR